MLLIHCSVSIANSACATHSNSVCSNIICWNVFSNSILEYIERYCILHLQTTDSLIHLIGGSLIPQMNISLTVSLKEIYSYNSCSLTLDLEFIILLCSYQSSVWFENQQVHGHKIR